MTFEERVLEIVLKARDEASKQIQQVGKEAGGLQNLLAGSFKNAAILSGAALAGLAAEAVHAVGAFQESENAVTQLEAVLKSTSGVAGITKDKALELASGFQRLTAYSDESVLGAENLLLTFTNISKDTFPKALDSVLNMSSALGQDLKSSAIQVGKALQDPILGVTALRRVGVNFSEAQQEMIKKMVESGKALDAQKFILKELQTEFGGSAEAAGKTFAGKLTILKNTLNDVEEAIGGLIVKGLTPIIDNVQMFVDNLMPMINGTEDWRAMIGRMEEDFGTFGVVLGEVVGFFATHKEAVVALAGAIGGFLVIALGAVSVAMISFIGLSLPVIAIAAAIGAGAALLIANWGTITVFFTNLWNSVTSAFESAKTAIGNTIQGVIVWFQELPTAVQQILYELFFIQIPFDIGFVAGWLSTAVPAMINNVVAWFGQLPQKVSEIFEQIKQWIITRFTETSSWIGKELPTWPVKIKEFLQSIPGIVSTIFNDMKEGALGKMKELWEGVTGWWEKIKDIFENIKHAINDAIGSVKSGFEAGKISGRSFQEGGFVPSTGLAYLHAGEFVLSRDMLSGRSSVPSSVTNTNYSNPVNIDKVVVEDIADIDLLAQRLAFHFQTSGQL